MRDATAGDPITGLKWTHKSLRAVALQLQRQHHQISAPTVARLLAERGYGLCANQKQRASKQSPGRDEQFVYIAKLRATFLKRKRPVISVDSKKRELVGPFKQRGQQWRKTAHTVLIYDFRSDAVGIAIPYGIYDVGRNRGYIVVGTSHDTAQFAVAAIRSWWMDVGRTSYPEARHLLIEADCGGSNANTSRAWKQGLQELADEFSLTIIVTHYPTGASKWNPIEHRCFNLISASWAGQPLDTYETVLKFIRSTRSTTGFRCRARLDQREYPTGITISQQQSAAWRIDKHALFPHWNYTVKPRRRR